MTLATSESIADIEYRQALAAVDAPDLPLGDQIDMLIEIAMGLQQRPKTPKQLHDAVSLYDRALGKCPEGEPLLAARIHARRATARQAIPHDGPQYLQAAQDDLQAALVTFGEIGLPEETAEAQMNLGLVLQSLASMGRAKITDAIAAYQRAARFFRGEAYATEYAILHNNLATAYLSISMTDEKGRMREALAVQCFEDALQVVTLIDNPTEYAMLQNNLGNALQYVTSSHAVENNLRALEAYDEALKVRTSRETPIEYANTIANKANCLANLPDDPEHPALGNAQRLHEARSLLLEARRLFQANGEGARLAMLDEALSELFGDGADTTDSPAEDESFGKARI